jgi:TPP-dependent pyruvate/acetoin dehydrogenase alpha subunit
LMTYRRKGHAEHDNQSYVPPGEIERWAAENDPIDRYERRLTEEFGFDLAEIRNVDSRVTGEIDRATDEAEASPMPEPEDALLGVYADPATIEPLWFREGGRLGTTTHERPEGWGTWSEAQTTAAPALPAREND